jgi:hypothetical protein
MWIIGGGDSQLGMKYTEAATKDWQELDRVCSRPAISNGSN